MALVCFVQLLLVGKELGAVLLVHSTGKEVLLRLRGVDPRSLFRGQYVRLEYEFSRIRRGQLFARQPVMGQEVYVILRPDTDGVHREEQIVLERPDPSEGQLFIRGTYGPGGRIQYGIEAYFASPERALELERLLTRRECDMARVRLGESGRAALVSLVCADGTQF